MRPARGTSYVGIRLRVGAARPNGKPVVQIMTAAGLLGKNRKPTREQIVEHMKGNLCRCGTYNQIVAAIQRAAGEMQKA